MCDGLEIRLYFMNVFMLEENVTNANIIKVVEQCESFSIVICYVSRPIGACGRFHSLTRVINLRIEVSHPGFDIMSTDFIDNVL